MIKRTLTIWLLLCSIASAVDFDSTDKVVITSDASLNNTRLSVVVWFRPDAVKAGGEQIAGRDDVGSDRLFSMHCYSNTLAAWIWDSGGTAHFLQDSVSPSNGTWYHWALTYDGTDQKLHRNGTISTLTWSGNAKTATEDLWIGNRTSSLPFDGQIQGFALYDRGLTNAEVAAKRFGQNQVPATVSSLLMNDASGTPSTYADISGNGNDGTNTGTTGIADGPPTTWFSFGGN